jgi:DNA-binding Lrp family transcriptional regulator/ssDNA-binding Zn-finger/Zn-ribbon topoisomerase 1
MASDLDEITIKLLKYILSDSKTIFSLEDVEQQLGMSTTDVLNALRKLEKMGAIKLKTQPTPDFILKNLVSEAAKYDLMYLIGEIDEQTYRKKLEELSLRPSLKELPIDTTCLTSNLIDLKEALNNMEYLLQVINELIVQPSLEIKKGDKQKILGDFLEEFLDQLIYIHGFLNKLRLMGEMASESLENFKKLRIEIKIIASKKHAGKYEETRKNVIKNSIGLFMLGSILYPEVLHTAEEDRRRCDACGKNMQIYWKYCKFCGAKIIRVFLPMNSTKKSHAICYNCKAVLPVGNKNCPECGFNIVEEITRVERALSELKVELELLNARKLIEEDALSDEIQEREIKYRETESRLEELRKASQESEYVPVETPGYAVVDTDPQKFHSFISKKIVMLNDLMSKAGLHTDDAFKVSVKEILENEKEVMGYIQNLASELPLALQEYNMIAEKNEEFPGCSSCGLKNDKDALFCIECGNSLEHAS